MAYFITYGQLGRYLPGMKPCKLWTGHCEKSGYGRVKKAGRKILAHRMIWEQAHGPIPAGMLVCHHCDNPSCVRLDHLFLGTHRDNKRDSTGKDRHALPDNRGERHGLSKLTEGQVWEILESSEIQRVVANRFSINQSTVSDIRRRKLWRHL